MISIFLYNKLAELSTGVVTSFQKTITSGSANDLKSFGFYNFSNLVSDTPFSYGILLTIQSPSSGYDMLFQLAVQRNMATTETPKVAFRTYRDGGNYGWSQWLVIGG